MQDMAIAFKEILFGNCNPSYQEDSITKGHCEE
jgi:hypothetical protein